MVKIKLGDISFITKLAGFEHTKYIQGNNTHEKISEDDVPLFIGKTVQNGKIDKNFDWYIPKELSNQLERSKLNKKCLVLPYVGSVGDLAIFDASYDAHLGSNIAKIELAENCGYSEEFIYYFLKSDYGQKILLRDIQGAIQKNITMKAIREVSLPDISIQEQNNIVSILKSLDDKIQTNNQINQELEAMAKTLYDYWFVQFDFPDQNGKPYKSSGGRMVYNPELKREIPEGWGVETLVDNTLSKVIKPGIDHFTQKTYLATSDVVNTSIKDGRLITFENRETRANMQPSVNSVWFAKMKSSNKHLFLPHSMKELIDSTILSTGFMGLQCKEESFEYIASFISDPNFEIFKDTLSHGATQEAVNIDDLRSVPVIIPDDYILREFHRIAKSIFLNLGRNMIEDKTLSSLRDWLLPMLMNGQVKVE